MTYWEAMTFAVSGKKIRRKSKPDFIYFMNAQSLFCYDGTMVKVVSLPEADDVLADDWELSAQHNKEIYS